MVVDAGAQINRDAAGTPRDFVCGAGSNAFRHAWALAPIGFVLVDPFRAELGLGTHVSGYKKVHSAGARHPNSFVTFVKEIGHDYCKQCISGQSNYDQSVSAARMSLAIATLLWAGNFIVGRALREDMAPLELNFWRWAIALAALLPFTLRSLWLGRTSIARDAGFIAKLAVTEVVVPHTCIYAALATPPVPI